MLCQNKTTLLQFDKAVPRYTSYPPAPHFAMLSHAQTPYEWLASVTPNDKVSLYLHVPFCPKLCWYCGCNTKITQRYAPVEDYAHLLLREIDLICAALPKNNPTPLVNHIHFGGGSPGMLRARDFAMIMEKLQSRFNITPDAQIAIELDPREVTESRIETYARHGVNRVSLGTQDFHEKTLKAINREQPFALTQTAIALCRKHGIQGINLDLLYGLPYQSVESMARTIDQVVSLNPDRISLFGYAHVPWMKKHMRLIDTETLPDKALRFDLFECGAQILQQAGYQSIGIDHFAKPDDPLAQAAQSGTLKRNFQGYTTDTSDILIGIGASSISRFKQGYLQNAIDMPLYHQAILDSRLPAQKHYLFTADDLLRSDIIEALMCHFAVDLKKICDNHQADFAALNIIWDDLKPYEEAGFIKLNQQAGQIEIKNNAKPIARLVCHVFDTHTAQQSDQPRHAKAI